MKDETEKIRREQMELIISNPQPKEVIAQHFGKVWNTQELGHDFEVHGFMAPYVVVTRKADKQIGSLMFQPQPRYYFAFEPHHAD